MADQALVAKRIPNTNVLVDGFRFQGPEFATYFLTHAHSDHTTGLTRGFCAGTIYCSPVTAALILHDTPRVKDTARVVALEVGRTHRIEDGRCGSFEVTLVDANHCPGACVLVFDVPFVACAPAGGGGGGEQEATTATTAATTTRRIVHTGDFRFHGSLHGRHPLLLSSSASASAARSTPSLPPPPQTTFPPSSSHFSPLPSLPAFPNPGLPIDILLLDTTYAHPRHCHPAQELAIRACAEFCRREAAKSLPALTAAPPLLPAARLPSPSAASAASAIQPPPLPLPPRPLFVFGSYRIGKERLYLGVAEELGWKVWVPPQKRGLLELLGLLSDGDDDAGGSGGDAKDGDDGGGDVAEKKKQELHLHRRYPRSLLADSPTEAVLHVAPMGASLTPPALLSRLQPGGEAAASGCGRVVGIRPTGWTYRRPRKGGAREGALAGGGGGGGPSDLCSALVTSYSPLPGVTVAGVPYSEHSSFPELRAAVAAMKPRRLVPTVTGGTAGDREAIVERFSDLLDRRRDRSRLDFFFSAAAKKGEEKEGEEEECEVKAEARLTKAAAKKSNGGGGGDDDEGIQVKEERGSDCEDDDDDSWGPPRGGDDWALDGDEEREEAKEEAKEAWAASPPPAPPPPPPPPPPQAPFDLSSVDESEQRRIMAEIQVVVSAERLLRDLQQGGEGGSNGGKRRRQPTLAAFAAASKKNK